MKNILSIITFVASTALLSSCATSFEKPSEDLDYGLSPKAKTDTIKEYFSVVLKDPDSANYKFGSPVKAYCNKGLAFGGKLAWTGWVLPFSINAKNSYGGYTGFKGYYARLDNNGQPIDISEDMPNIWDFVPVVGVGCQLVK